MTTMTKHWKRASGPQAMMFLVLVIIGAAVLYRPLSVASQGVIVIDKGREHANEKHAEARSVRRRYRDGLCEGTELWYSPTHGTILILCGIPDGLWGGLVYRVTENLGKSFLPPGDAYECTVYLGIRSYWDGVIARDGYVPLANYPNVKRYVFATFGK